MKTVIRNRKVAEAILDCLLAGPLTTLDNALATRAGKQATLRKLREFDSYPNHRPSQKLMHAIKEARHEYIKYHSFMKRLQKNGLVTQSGTGKSKSWTVATAGKQILETYKKQSRLAEEAIRPGGTTIISYDIPERIHSERDAMRDLLKLFGFTFVHQSLWYANVTVERRFIDYLRERKLLDYVHIFQITKSGTLESVER